MTKREKKEDRKPIPFDEMASDGNWQRWITAEDCDALRTAYDRLREECGRLTYEKEVRDAERIQKWAASVMAQEDRAIAAESERDSLREERAKAQRYVSDANEEINLLRSELARRDGALRELEEGYRERCNYCSGDVGACDRLTGPSGCRAKNARALHAQEKPR